MGRNNFFRILLLSICFLVFAFIISLKVGAVPGADSEIILQLRLPRAILALSLGMGLALAGATLQAVFTNPLCEPYTLGISSGAALGAIFGISLGVSADYAGIAGFGFLGALVFALILFLISYRAQAGQLSLLLAGVMLGLLGSSLVAVWMALADSNGIQGALFWLMGDLSRARLKGTLIVFALRFNLFLFIWKRSLELDALLMGEEGAQSLGVSVKNVRRRMILLTSILVGICVGSGGMIGFIGLIIPHLCRQWIGSLHYKLLPLCVIWGATALILADTLSRVVASPYELPVGVVTAIVGAPFFIWIMLKRGEILA